MQLKSVITATALAVSTLASAHDIPSLAITDLSVAPDRQGVVTVRMNVNPRDYALGRDREVVLTPVIYNSDSTAAVAMPAVVIVGRDRFIRYQRRPETLPAGTVVLRAGKDAPYAYTAAADWQPWMEVSTVALDAREHGCCGVPHRNTSTPVAHLDLRPREFVVPDFVAEAVVIDDDKTVEVCGSAFVDFPVNRTEIKPEYRRNPEELAKILATINNITENPDAAITDITIKGYASPEGKYDANARLAKGRTQSLKDYVMQRCAFDASVYHTDYEPEDWAGLRDYVAKSALDNRAAILDIIDSDMAPDAKDAAIKRKFPADYAFLLKNVYPGLRHSDYTVRYGIRHYTDIDEIRRVMRERPSNLSLAELHKLAMSYTPGSDEYNEVFDVAVRMFPEDSVSNINAAAVAINKADYTAAVRYLERVSGSAAVPYLKGIMLARQGDTDAARKELEQARAAGVPQAAQALANLDELVSLSEALEYIPDSAPRTFTR